MKYNLIINQNKKLGLFSDQHFGVNKDNQIRLQQTVKCIDWIIKTFKENSVDYVIFCGDLFDSRFSINVNTLNYGIQSIKKFADNFQKVFLICGNHDTYYKNTNQVNSINFLSSISDKNNIIIIQNDPYFIQMQSKTLGLYPWGYGPQRLNEIKNYQKCDYGFGHFQVNGIQQIRKRFFRV